MRRDGYAGICVFNLCVLRATDPKQLRAVEASDPTEPLMTEQWLGYAATRFERAVCAWGNVSKAMRYERVGRTVRMLVDKTELLCLGRTLSGQPRRRSLYVKKDRPFLPF